MEAKERKRLQVRRTIGYGTYSDKELMECSKIEGIREVKKLLSENRYLAVAFSGMPQVERDKLLQQLSQLGQAGRRLGWQEPSTLWNDKTHLITKRGILEAKPCEVVQI